MESHNRWHFESTRHIEDFTIYKVPEFPLWIVAFRIKCTKVFKFMGKWWIFYYRVSYWCYLSLFYFGDMDTQLTEFRKVEDIITAMFNWVTYKALEYHSKNSRSYILQFHLVKALTNFSGGGSFFIYFYIGVFPTQYFNKYAMKFPHVSWKVYLNTVHLVNVHF